MAAEMRSQDYCSTKYSTVTAPLLVPNVIEFTVEVDDREVNEEFQPAWRVKLFDVSTNRSSS